MVTVKGACTPCPGSTMASTEVGLVLVARRAGAPGGGISRNRLVDGTVGLPFLWVATAVIEYVWPGSKPLSEQVDVAHVTLLLLPSSWRVSVNGLTVPAGASTTASAVVGLLMWTSSSGALEGGGGGGAFPEGLRGLHCDPRLPLDHRFLSCRRGRFHSGSHSPASAT